MTSIFRNETPDCLATPLPKPPTIQAPSSLRKFKKVPIPPLMLQTFDEWWQEELKAKRRIALETNTPELRAKSFETNKWPLQYPTSQQLVDAGFKYTPTKSVKDITHCITCNLYADGWDKSDDPYEQYEAPPTYPGSPPEEAYKRDPETNTPSTPEAVAAERMSIASTAESTPTATPPSPSEPALMLTSPVSHPEPTIDNSLPITPPATPTATPEQSTPTSPATPRKQISWAEIVSRSVVAPKPSRLPVPTPKIVPTCTETAPITCPPTPPPTPPQKPVPKHQHQEQKPYLTIEDLFEMFAEKRTKSGLLHTKKSKSPPKLSNQTKITAYFRPAANQSKPITQGSKTPNPRSFQQHTPAESNRAKSTPSKWSEKSAILPYKTSTFSRLHTSEISSNSPYKMPGISCLQPMAAPCKSSAHLPVSPTIQSSSKPPSISRAPAPAAYAMVLSDRTMACIGTYEQSISTKHLAMDLRSMRPGAISWLEIVDRIAEKQALFLLHTVYYY
ncbi:hypothetical protein G7Y79_00077g099560 [Physcia stellaris]|nr:hypothetical protein G7Y79_00077g099560 [Physcia stellaris]